MLLGLDRPRRFRGRLLAETKARQGAVNEATRWAEQSLALTGSESNYSALALLIIIYKPRAAKLKRRLIIT